MNPKQPLPPLWMGLWVPLLAMAWLIPNHYYPWATFHTDAWVAVMLAIAGGAVFTRSTRQVEWHGITTLIALLTTVPFLQFAAGMLSFSGEAWLITAYLMGFLLTLLAGAHWEGATPGRAADSLFLAIGIAAILSVWLQLRQWLGLAAELETMQVWTAEFTRERPSANLGQPNQLATLLLWGLLAFLWGVARKKINPACAIFGAIFLLFGIALTQSRMPWIALSILTLAGFAWRRLWPARTPWVFLFLLLCFFGFTFSLSYLSEFLTLGIDVRSATLGGKSSQLRLKAIIMFLDALWQQPWVGYGWNQLASAQLAVAKNHPNMTSFFIQSHNLFLDLVLWCGIPIGVGASLYLVAWMLRCIKRTTNSEDAVLTLFILVVAIHAMVELPLHHAYFLLPTGLVMGMLNQRLRSNVIFRTNRWWILGSLLCTSLLLGVIIRDYLRVDASFRAYRLEVNHIGNLPPGKPPEVIVLNDLREFIRNARTEVQPNISSEELELLRRITKSFPTPFNLFNYTKALAFRHETVAARDWMEKIQKVQPDSYVQNLREVWTIQSQTEPAMAAVPWPPANAESK
nr:Wzy polymerase domain-containing protein [uncultured Albidiferax sp.]